MAGRLVGWLFEQTVSFIGKESFYNVTDILE
jgi:hypothetical protein